MFASGSVRFEAERLPLTAKTADRIMAKDKVHHIHATVAPCSDFRFCARSDYCSCGSFCTSIHIFRRPRGGYISYLIMPCYW